MSLPTNLRFSEDHEWINPNGEVATVGITDFAQGELGDIVFVELPTEGDVLAKEEIFGTVEAVKTVSDLFMPVSGEIIEVNEVLENTPELVNSDPYGAGWMIKIRMTDPSELDDLMDDEAYAVHIAGDH